MAESKAPEPNQVLAGVRVLDIAVFLAAPYCAALLSDFGADVIKIELPKVGDPVRWLGVMWEGTGMQWRTVNRNKRTITLDLRKERGKELFLELVKQSDVLVENFTPGTLDRWGLGYDRLREINPGLILTSISGYGQNGPYRTRPAVARIAMAFGGLTHLVGEPEGQPLTPGVAGLADYMGGIYAAFGTMLALRHRDRTGKGQHVDLALFEPVFHMLEDAVEAYDKLGQIKWRTGSANPNAAPHNNFPSKDGRWVAIGCSSDELYSRLCNAMERPDLRDLPQFKTNPLRVENRKEIEGIVSDWTTRFDAADAVERLERFGVPVSLIYTIADIFADEQIKARENIIQVDTDHGPLAVRSVIPRLVDTPGGIQRLAGAIGRDNAEVYGGLLNLDEAQIEALRTEGVI